MMNVARLIRRLPLRILAKENKGGAAVEFAILAPFFLTLIFGVMQVGVYLQNYNAVQSLASDGARYVMVEYQKENALSDEQIRTVMLGEAVNAPYMLESDRLNVAIDRTGTSRVNGASEIDLTLTYALSDFMPIDLPGGTITYTRSVWVVAPATVTGTGTGT